MTTRPDPAPLSTGPSTTALSPVETGEHDAPRTTKAGTQIDYSKTTSTFMAWCNTCQDCITNVRSSSEALAWTQQHTCTPKEPT